MPARVAHVHIVGAGLGGLSAAVALARHGVGSTIYEAGPAAGGRCRSYFDRELGCRIDNGNHLLLSGNRAAMTYLDTIGAGATMGGPGVPRFPFIDLATGERWTIAPDPGRMPWWIFSRSRRVPGTGLSDYLSLFSLRGAGSTATVTEVLDPTRPLYRRLLEPLAIAALNTPPDTALAHLLQTVMNETLLRGGHACIPMFPREGLSESFVDPALAWLAPRGGRLQVNRRIAGLRVEGGRVTALETPDGPVTVAAREAVVMAAPPWVAPNLLPDLIAPDGFQSILNVHFRIDADPGAGQGEAGADSGTAGFIGVLGGTAEWIFIKPGIVAVTISAANRIVDLAADELAARVWPDVRTALNLPAPMPPVRVVKEKRATFAATAEQEARRPAARAPRETACVQNLVLAGDWTATGLPATIEGAIRSGTTAVEAILDSV
jgi:squalene-associated FAD-dependent desaturase